jgi:hypothetical protein
LTAALSIGHADDQQVVVALPDIINPVSLSPVVSTNGRAETNRIKTIRASAWAAETDVGEPGKFRSSRNVRSLVQSTVGGNVEGEPERALASVEVTVVHSYVNVFLLVYSKSENRAACEFRGELVRVR